MPESASPPIAARPRFRRIRLVFSNRPRHLNRNDIGAQPTHPAGEDRIAMIASQQNISYLLAAKGVTEYILNEEVRVAKIVLRAADRSEDKSGKMKEGRFVIYTSQ